MCVFCFVKNAFQSSDLVLLCTANRNVKISCYIFRSFYKSSISIILFRHRCKILYRIEECRIEILDWRFEISEWRFFIRRIVYQELEKGRVYLFSRKLFSHFKKDNDFWNFKKTLRWFFYIKLDDWQRIAKSKGVGDLW